MNNDTNALIKLNDVTFSIYGMRRSGLHCIAYDITYNYSCDKKIGLIFINDIQDHNKIAHRNGCVLLFEDNLKYVKSDIKIEYNILIIRDIYDNIISRIGTGGSSSWAKIDQNYLDTLKYILSEFLNISNTVPNKILINYNKYIFNTGYRYDILRNKLNITHVKQFPKLIPKYGGGKTFKNINDRKNVIINRSIYSLIERDTQFVSLTKAYFNYDLLSKLIPHVR